MSPSPEAPASRVRSAGGGSLPICCLPSPLAPDLVLDFVCCEASDFDRADTSFRHLWRNDSSSDSVFAGPPQSIPSGGAVASVSPRPERKCKKVNFEKSQSNLFHVDNA